MKKRVRLTALLLVLVAAVPVTSISQAPGNIYNTTLVEIGQKTAEISTEELRAILAAGTAVGFLTGLFGVGGGFVIVPALTLALGLSMPLAIGTSLVTSTKTVGVRIPVLAATAANARSSALSPVTAGRLCVTTSFVPPSSRTSTIRACRYS